MSGFRAGRTNGGCVGGRGRVGRREPERLDGEGVGRREPERLGNSQKMTCKYAHLSK